MTEYVVLRHEGDGRWLHVLADRPKVRSAKEAIRAHAEALEEDSGTGEAEYVAVPARSWKPVTVKVETKTALRFS